MNAYTTAGGNEYSNSDDVVSAFVSDCAQWSAGGKTGYSAQMARGKKLVLIDIGANVGGFSNMLMSSFNLGPGTSHGQIHAFEPYEITHKTLRANINPGAPVYLHRIALTDAETVAEKKGVAEFFGAYLEINPNPTGASIGRTEAVQVPVGTVPLSTFDDYFDKVMSQGELKGVDFVVPLFKVDVEGMEIPVLRGAKRFLVKYRPQAVTIEWGEKWAKVNPKYTLQEALDFMQSLGYEAFHSGNSRSGVFHWLPLSCGLFDATYDRTMDNKFNHYASTNIFFVRTDQPWLERFRKVHVYWENEKCVPNDWQSRSMP